MKEKLIKFSNVDDARVFIANADQCNFDIDVHYNHITLDGKSIMALLSMDFTQPVTVKYNGENPNFESMLSRLAVS